MVKRNEAEIAAARLKGEIAEVCGLLNATMARLVRLIADVLATGSWEGWRIRSPEHWVAWKCGVSPGHARSLVAMALRLGELPQTREAFEAGELSEDQVAVVCRQAPAAIDAEAAEFARSATVTQLRRVLGGYSFEVPARSGEPQPQEPRHVSFGYTDTGSWQLRALLPADEGAAVERILTEARQALVKAGDRGATWADAFAAVVDRSPGRRRAGPARATVLLHLDRQGSHLHLGPALPDGLLDYLSCDSHLRAVWEEDGRAVSVGRTFRTVPDRTRTVIEERDRGCRVPGCSRTHWIHVHHIQHWRAGGPTDTGNLLALCSKHHRLLHLGHLRIQGNADEPDGLVFTDERGRPFTDYSCPRPPSAETAARLGILPGRWAHPPGYNLDAFSIFFPDPAA